MSYLVLYSAISGVKKFLVVDHKDSERKDMILSLQWKNGAVQKHLFPQKKKIVLGVQISPVFRVGIGY